MKKSKVFEIVIVADTNDGDDVTAINDITKEELEKFLPLIEAIKKFDQKHKRGSGKYNWPAGEHMRGTCPEETYPDIDPALIDYFREYLPYGEHGIHTIESIEYYNVPIKTKLL